MALCASCKASADFGYAPDFGELAFARHTVFQQHCRDAPGGEPVADFRAFQIDGEKPIAAAGKHHHRRAGIGSLRREPRHRRLRDVVHVDPRLAGDQVGGVRRKGLRAGDGPRIGRRTGPDQRLLVSCGRLPNPDAGNFATDQDGGGNEQKRDR